MNEPMRRAAPEGCAQKTTHVVLWSAVQCREVFLMHEIKITVSMSSLVLTFAPCSLASFASPFRGHSSATEGRMMVVGAPPTTRPDPPRRGRPVPTKHALARYTRPRLALLLLMVSSGLEPPAPGPVLSGMSTQASSPFFVVFGDEGANIEAARPRVAAMPRRSVPPPHHVHDPR